MAPGNPSFTTGVPATAGMPVVRAFDPTPFDAAFHGQRVYVLSGVTYDATNVALSNCVVDLFRTSDDLKQYTCLSDANGVYTFNLSDAITYWYAVGYKVGSPDVAGTTRADLIPT